MNQMSGSQNAKRGDFILALYRDVRRVFTLTDAALVSGERRFASLNRKLNYGVRTGKLLCPRRGLYAKPGFTAEELACKLYRPSYISLEYALQRAGVVFQYDGRITLAAPLSRTLEIQGRVFAYRKIKGPVLAQTAGVEMGAAVCVAVPERAFLDLLYLDRDYYFDNLAPLNRERVFELLPLYECKALAARVRRLFAHGRE